MPTPDRPIYANRDAATRDRIALACDAIRDAGYPRTAAIVRRVTWPLRIRTPSHALLLEVESLARIVASPNAVSDAGALYATGQIDLDELEVRLEQAVRAERRL